MKDTLDQLEKKLKSGLNREVRAELLKLSKKRMMRRLAPQFASLLRRTGLATQSVRLLHKYFQKSGEASGPTDKEVFEYCSSLNRIGATKESLQKIQQFTPKGKEFHLIRGAAHIQRWDYIAAQKEYEEFLTVSNQDYQALIARLNLTACQNYNHHYQNALENIQIIKSQAKAHDYNIVLGNALELEAQVRLGLKEYKQALKLITDAEGYLKNASPLWSLVAKKWRLVCSYFLKAEKKTLKDLKQLTTQASNKGFYEISRNCEFYLAQFLSDQNLFLKQFFGTPYESYREKYIKEHLQKIPSSYQWQIKRCRNELNLAHFTFNGQKIDKTNGLLNRTALAITRDFYQPQSLARIFETLYPSEIYNPFTSPNRIHQAINRLKQLFSKHQIHLEIQSLNQGYLLTPSSETALITPLPSLPAEGIMHHYLLKNFPARVFKRSSIEELLGLNSRAASYKIKQWIEEGFVEKEGQGKRIKYRLIDQS